MSDGMDHRDMMNLTRAINDLERAGRELMQIMRDLTDSIENLIHLVDRDGTTFRTAEGAVSYGGDALPHLSFSETPDFPEVPLIVVVDGERKVIGKAKLQGDGQVSAEVYPDVDETLIYMVSDLGQQGALTVENVEGVPTAVVFRKAEETDG